MAFVCTSSFVRGRGGATFAAKDAICASRSMRPGHLKFAKPAMMASTGSPRSDEIERLTKQLEELRTMRERIAKKGSSHSASSSPSPSASSATPASPSTPVEASSPLNFGKHGAENRFVSVSSVDAEENYPRTILISGNIPGLSTEEFKSTPAMLHSKKPKKGNLFLSQLPEGFEGPFVSLPGTDALVNCGDPVAVLIDPELFSFSKLPITKNEDVLLVIDRAVKSLPFDRNQFYAWDVGGQISIGWLNSLPPKSEAQLVGRVAFGVIEIDPELRVSKSCWEEENETYS